MEIPYEKTRLDNGLGVVLHEDHTNPVVSVNVVYHVGSARERLGASGFAHLFEHLMFQGSENVPADSFFRYVQEAGGTANGGTSSDMTIYYETVPSNRLELPLWLESDRMGHLLETLDQEKLDNQRDVVIEERRQTTENRPYALGTELRLRNLYPQGHPYSWTTIGSVEDLTKATLDDVRAFFQRWYGPNNATLVIGGDFERKDALRAIERYFGAIPRGPAVPRTTPWTVTLPGERRLVMEDRVPLEQLTLEWPTVPAMHPDEPALNMLLQVLSANRSSILDKTLCMDERLAAMLTAGHYARELAGSLYFSLRPHEGVTLDRLEERLRGLLLRVRDKGVPERDLERVKACYEAGTVRGLEQVEERARTLARYECFLSDPGYLPRDLERHLAVTTEDLVQVLDRYVVGRPCLMLSIVPAGETSRALEGSRPEAEPAAAASRTGPDRSSPPAGEPQPDFHCPAVWRAELPGGVQLLGTPETKIPATRLMLAVPAGRLRQGEGRYGLASMTAALLKEGVRGGDGTELQRSLDELGATLQVGASEEELQVELDVLDKHLCPAVEILAAVLTEPTLAAPDLDRLRAERQILLRARLMNPRDVAGDAWRGLLHGPESACGCPALGTPESLDVLEDEHVRSFWRANSGPQAARALLVSKLDAAGAADALEPLLSRWSTDGREPASVPEVVRAPRAPGGPRLFFVDVPGAKQSELRIGHLGLSALDEDYYPLYVLNYVLGGSFSSRLNMNLREDKGYTYGVRSTIGAGRLPRSFLVSTGVGTEVTAPAVAEVLSELRRIHDGVTQDELTLAQDALLKALCRQYASRSARQALLNGISFYGYSERYPEERAELLRGLTTAALDEQARRHLLPEETFVLVAGDVAAVRGPLEELGLGEAELLDGLGRPVR